MTVLAPEDAGSEEPAPAATGPALAAPAKEQPPPVPIGAPPRARFEAAVKQALTRIVEIVAAGTEEVSAVLWLDEECGDGGLPDGRPGETAAAAGEARAALEASRSPTPTQCSRLWAAPSFVVEGLSGLASALLRGLGSSRQIRTSRRDLTKAPGGPI